MPKPMPSWPPRRQSPPAPPVQQALLLEPSADELLAEVQRIWQGRLYFRRRFNSLEALLSDPQRRKVLTLCARQALLARQRRQRCR